MPCAGQPEKSKAHSPNAASAGKILICRTICWSLEATGLSGQNSGGELGALVDFEVLDFAHLAVLVVDQGLQLRKAG